MRPPRRIEPLASLVRPGAFSIDRPRRGEHDVLRGASPTPKARRSDASFPRRSLSRGGSLAPGIALYPFRRPSGRRYSGRTTLSSALQVSGLVTSPGTKRQGSGRAGGRPGPVWTWGWRLSRMVTSSSAATNRRASEIPMNPAPPRDQDRTRHVPRMIPRKQRVLLHLGEESGLPRRWPGRPVGFCATSPRVGPLMSSEIADRPMGQSSSVAETWLPGIEALRGIAAASVVAHHCWALGTTPRFPGSWLVRGFGSWGVDSSSFCQAICWPPTSGRADEPDG